MQPVMRLLSSLKCSGLGEGVLSAIAVGAIVFLACLLGIYTRPMGFVVMIWPANAVLLGIFVRRPDFATRMGWTAAAAAYLAADLLTGGGLLRSVFLNVANLVGVAAGFVLFNLLSDEDRNMKRPASVLHMFSIAVIAAAFAAFVGAKTVQVFFGSTYANSLVTWFVVELLNYIVILPVCLTAPAGYWQVRIFANVSDPSSVDDFDPRPVGALVLTSLAAIAVGGPGAIAFPVPALLWCALSYSLFTSTALTALLCLLTQVAVSAEVFGPDLASSNASLNSIRLGIMLLSLGPLTVASINSVRNELIARLSAALNYDALTGCLSREAFMRDGAAAVSDAVGQRQSIFALMIDMDRFKSINDTYGHAAGDRVLKIAAARIRALLNGGQTFGRLGGEEFAIVFSAPDHAAALAWSESLVRAVREAEVELHDGTTLRVTMSAGLSASARNMSLEKLLNEADGALYRAKAAGRDRVVPAAPEV